MISSSGSSVFGAVSPSSVLNTPCCSRELSSHTLTHTHSQQHLQHQLCSFTELTQDGAKVRSTAAGQHRAGKTVFNCVVSRSSSSLERKVKRTLVSPCLFLVVTVRSASRTGRFVFCSCAVCDGPLLEPSQCTAEESPGISPQQVHRNNSTLTQCVSNTRARVSACLHVCTVIICCVRGGSRTAARGLDMTPVTGPLL